MKSKLFVTLLVVSVALSFVIGCGEEAEKTEMPATEKVVKGTGTEAPVRDMVETSGSAFESMKSEYLKEAKDAISEWDVKIKEADKKINTLPEIARKPLEEPFKAVTDSRVALDGKFNDLKGVFGIRFNISFFK